MSQIVNINYGHNGRGKLYSYRDRGNHRAGDEVKVPVTNPQSGKTYMTMGVIKSTHGQNTAGAQDTREYLDDQGISLKSVAGGSLRELPGFKKMQEKYGKDYTLQDWRSDAKAADDLENEYRLLPNMTQANFARIKRQIMGLR